MSISLILRNKILTMASVGSAALLWKVVDCLFNDKNNRKAIRAKRRESRAKEIVIRDEKLSVTDAIKDGINGGFLITEATEEEIWNTVLFFPDIFPENENSTTRRLIWYLRQAKYSLKLCMYVSSFKMLEKELFRLAEKRVKVQAITNVGRFIPHWRSRGVDVREKPKMIRSQFFDDVYMDLLHHKFLIIDDQAILTGSLNWTRSAITENREHVTITNNEYIVQEYLEEFERLWQLSEPEEPYRLRNRWSKHITKKDSGRSH